MGVATAAASAAAVAHCRAGVLVTTTDNIRRTCWPSPAAAAHRQQARRQQRLTARVCLVSK